MSKRLAIDVGGTFIDFVLLDQDTGSVSIEKEPSLLRESAAPLITGMERLGIALDELEMITHGSTVVINTILQEVGADIGLITTQGFRDVLELGRGNRPEVYNLLYKPQKPLVPRYLRFEVPERLNHKGEVICPLDENAVRQAASKLKSRGVKGVAVCFLHAYANHAHEQRVRELILEEFPEAFVSISSDITREFREFERTSTVVLNTYVMPRMSSYLGNLESRLAGSGFKGSLNIIQSTGGMMASGEARNMPIRTLESGPAGGVIGAVALGQQIGQPNLIAADVGGTSFDVALIETGHPFEKSETFVNKRPVLQPTIDIASIGAGGGSIAWLDDAGGFRVGPQSAEADPGPVCFGKGGTEPTVTDAHVVLGRINPKNFLGQRMILDVDSARKAIEERIAKPLRLSVHEAAYGITHLADINMMNAIRQITIERGHDPRDFSLLSYGGGGGLFASVLMRELQINHAIIPNNPAVFSAWGILNSDFRDDAVRTLVIPTKDLSLEQFISLFTELSQESLEKLEASGFPTGDVNYIRFADMRYEGQEHTVRVPLPTDDELKANGMQSVQDRFDELHEQAYAHASPGMPTELVNLRVSAIAASQKPSMQKIDKGSGGGRAALNGNRQVYFKQSNGEVDCPTYDREKLGAGDVFRGPAIVEEWNSTIVVQPEQKLEVDAYGNLLISQEANA